MLGIAIAIDTAWLVAALLTLLVLTAVASISLHAWLAMAHDVMPFLLGAAWIVLVLAIVEGETGLAVLAGALSAYHLVLIVPRLRSERKPGWVASAPQLRIVVSNVFFENETPGLLAAQLLDADPDVIVIAEWNPRFAHEFDGHGGSERYASRVFDPDDHSDYAVCVLTKLELLDGSRMETVGPLTFAHAAVECGSRSVHVFGMNPTAVVDPGGYSSWRAQLNALIAHVPHLPRPFVLSGDLNTTRFRPQFRALLRTGVHDAHDSLGKGMSTSFKLAAKGPLAAPGTIVRLDHALLSRDVCAISARDLESCGSDHLPFELVLGVRQRHRPQRWLNRPEPASAQA